MESKNESSKLIISSASLMSSAVKPEQFLQDGKKEIALIGRSNVGKSSLINAIAGRKNLAYISKEPGKTKTVNYYSIRSRIVSNGQEERQEWYLVDLPGYGFAKTAGNNAELWSQFISDYIHQSKGLVMVGLLIDMRHPGLPIDLKAFQWLSKLVPNLQIVGTKLDKLKKSEVPRQLKLLDHYFPSAHPAIASSAQNGAGKDDLLELIKERISES